MDDKRRNFLKVSALAGAGSLLPTTNLTADPAPVTGTQNVQSYRRLGRTELKISDISFGSSRLRQGEEHLVDHALERGINYFDTAESYTRGQSETVLGRALKGKRDGVYLVSKTLTGSSTSAGQMMHAFRDDDGLAVEDILPKADAHEKLVETVAATLARHAQGGGQGESG